MVRSGDYYLRFWSPQYLESILLSARSPLKDNAKLHIFLAGDSSLDNKVWLFQDMMQTSQALNYDFTW